MMVSDRIGGTMRVLCGSCASGGIEVQAAAQHRSNTGSIAAPNMDLACEGPGGVLVVSITGVSVCMMWLILTNPVGRGEVSIIPGCKLDGMLAI